MTQTYINNVNYLIAIGRTDSAKEYMKNLYGTISTEEYDEVMFKTLGYYFKKR